MSSVLQAGLAKSAITPPVGISMSGYATRPSSAVGVHDDLFCKVSVFSNGEANAALVCLDLLGLNFEQVKWIRGEVEKRYGIPGSQVFVVCSHTHAGPATVLLRFCGTPDDDYLSGMLETVVETVGKALQDMAPCSVETGEASADLAINRRYRAPSGDIVLTENSEGFYDRQVKIVRICREGRPGAIMYNYSCHGVVLGPENVLISADWIGAASSYIEENTGDMAMFLQGCCGDINPRVRGGFDAVKTAGEMVGSAVVDALSDLIPQSGVPVISVSSKNVHIPFQPLPSAEELLKVTSEMQEHINDERSKGTPEYMLDWPKGLEEWSRVARETLEAGEVEDFQPVELSLLRVDGFRIFAVPGEVFSEYGHWVKSLAPDVLVAGYANGNIGYVPTAKAYEEGGYEVDGAYKLYGVQMIGFKAEEIIMSTARELVKAGLRTED